MIIIKTGKYPTYYSNLSKYKYKNKKCLKINNKLYSYTSKILLEIVEILLENYTEKKQYPKKDDTSNLRRSSRLKT